MKRFFSIIGTILICIVILPLLLAFLFAMPLEFIVSSWHNIKIDSSTQGLITHSEVLEGKGGNEGSSISYQFQIDGKSYESSRWRAVLISNSSSEAHGGEFAKSHPVGSKVTVYYDASNPKFSLLERGWPKWSFGFSLGVWGIMFANQFKRTSPRSTRLFIGYPLSRATTITGALTIFLLPPTLDASSFKLILLGFVVIAILAFIWLILCPSSKITADEEEEAPEVDSEMRTDK